MARKCTWEPENWLAGWQWGESVGNRGDVHEKFVFMCVHCLLATALMTAATTTAATATVPDQCFRCSCNWCFLFFMRCALLCCASSIYIFAICFCFLIMLINGPQSPPAPECALARSGDLLDRHNYTSTLDTTTSIASIDSKVWTSAAVAKL